MLADAYFGLGMLRKEAGADGWEQSLRIALGYGEQVQASEPDKPARPLWLSMVYIVLANQMEQASPRKDGSDERALGIASCERARTLTKTDEERQRVLACLDTANAVPD